MLVSRLELHVNLLLSWLGICSDDVEVDSEGLGLVNTTEVPLVGATNTDLSTGDVLCVFLILDGGALADDSRDLELFGAEKLGCRQEAHLQL